MNKENELVPGQISLANESRFEEAYLSEPLTAYATGWGNNEPLQDDLEFLAPQVLVPRRFEYRQDDNAEAFAMESEDIRAIGADFKRIDPYGSVQMAKTYNKGLTMRVDLDQVSCIPNWRQRAIARLLKSLLRIELQRALTLLTDSATARSVVWNTSSGKDPDADVLSAIEDSANSSGIHPNRVLYGSTAWFRRNLSHRAQNTAGGFSSASLTPQTLANLFNVDAVKVCNQRRQSSGIGKVGFAENLVLVFTAEANQSTEDPSNIKRFVTPCEDGSIFRVFEHNITGKLVDLTVEHYSNLVVTSNLGIVAITVNAS